MSGSESYNAHSISTPEGVPPVLFSSGRVDDSFPYDPIHAVPSAHVVYPSPFHIPSPYMQGPLHEDDQPPVRGVGELASQLGDATEAGGGSIPTTAGAKRWDAWEDRALARQVLADDPINCLRGVTQEKWQDVANHLGEMQSTGRLIVRSGESCRIRMKKLVMLHKKEQARSLQKTGTNEEINQFIQDMDEIVMRWDQGSVDPEVRQIAIEKARRLERDGREVRTASLLGMVRKRNGLDDGSIEEGVDSEGLGKGSKAKKVKKNESSKKIDAVLEEFYREGENDAAVLQELQDVEKRHHSEVVDGLKSLADELRADRQDKREEANRDRETRREEWLDIMRLFTRGFASEGSGNNM
ncbi:hypothetical protein DFP73DRAFT_529470 [Morchella snyderi]|nr:hypothetical protein DFP73DRAFT_529470 [Morchella snyderi]